MGAVEGANLYRYVNASPVQLCDPTGMEAATEPEVSHAESSSKISGDSTDASDSGYEDYWQSPDASQLSDSNLEWSSADKEESQSSSEETLESETSWFANESAIYMREQAITSADVEAEAQAQNALLGVGGGSGVHRPSTASQRQAEWNASGHGGAAPQGQGIRSPDFLMIGVGVSAGGSGVEGVVIVDRYGEVYMGGDTSTDPSSIPGFDPKAAQKLDLKFGKVEAEAFYGWLNQSDVPLPSELTGFLSVVSASAEAGYWVGAGILTNHTTSATLIGFMTPGISFEPFGYTSNVYTLPPEYIRDKR
jgi:hypothetical protein